MVELMLWSQADRVEALTDALLELEAMAVSVEDADAGTAAEAALFGEPGDAPAAGWPRSMLRALFTDHDRAQAAAAVLLARESNATTLLHGVADVPDDDWVKRSQAQFEPVEITHGFWIVPSWHAPPAAATRLIRLDPGLAFGTGTHPTTRMCLRWIAGNGQAWPRVLDYGCGSGILAIAAAMFGAREVDAVDIDPAAVDAAADNARANGVSLRTGLPEAAQGAYALVVANILATPLKVLAPLLVQHLASGSHLLLAGILDRQAGEVAAAYAPWLALEQADSEDGWTLLHGRLP